MDVDSGTARSATSPLPGPNTVPDLIAAARRGCPTSLGQVFEALRAQLIAIANEELPDGLRAKVGPSDLVQETAIDMQRNFDQFRGTTAEECFAWLRSILRNNVVDAVRHFQATRKRDLAREQSLDGTSRSAGGKMPVCDRLPEGSAIRHEDAAVVSRLLARLPPEQGRVIELRYWRSLSFAEIGAEMNRSTDAVRKLWYRALERLQAELAADRGAVAGQPDAAVTQRL
jgi:RNA polymerase sigma-70 factor (ECF subfamily)